MGVMFEFAVALGLCGATLLVLRGGLSAPNGTTIAGLDPQAMGFGLLAIIAAGYFWGPQFGLALILAVMLHEFGHVAAYRIAGHSDARFRLIPLMGGVAISDTVPASQDKAFFIALMGPGISLAPMVAAYAAADLLWIRAPGVSSFLLTFASVTAALNFFNLLPLWPLDGGRCVRIIAASILPGGGSFVLLAMSAGLIAIAIALQSFLLLAFALLGSQSLFQSEAILRAQWPMGRARALLAFAAYGFTMAAHFLGGALVITRFL